MKKISLVLAFLLALPILANAQATPTSKLGFDQDGFVAGMTFNYSIDGATKQVLSGSTCVATSGTFNCTAPLPASTTGAHSIVVFAVLNGSESAASAPLTYTMVAITAPKNLKIVAVGGN